MNKKVVSSLAMLLVGFATTAYAGGYHGDRYYSANINGAPVYSGTYTQAPTGIYGNTINTQAGGAELFISNDGNHNRFGKLNLNFGRVKAKTKTVTFLDNDSNVKHNEISTTGFGALTSIKSEGRGNRFFNINANKGRVSAKTETIAYNDIKFNNISTFAVGAYTGVESEGSNNYFRLYNKNGGPYFFRRNGNSGSVSAVTTTQAWDDIEGNNISTTAFGAQTYLKSTGYGNRAHILNVNKGQVRAVTNTWTDDRIDNNTIATTAVGATLSIDNTKVGGHRYGRRYYSSRNQFGSLNLNLGNVSAQTNTRGYSTITGNTISTTAVGASTSITTRTGGRH